MEDRVEKIGEAFNRPIPRPKVTFLYVEAEIRGDGRGSLMQNRFTEEAEKALTEKRTTRKTKVDRGTPREEASTRLYLHPETKNCMHPGAAILRLLREAGSFHKSKNTRRNVKFFVPAAVLIQDEFFPLFHYDGSKPYRAEEVEVDSRTVVIPANKARIMRHRPRFDGWTARFNLRINPGILEAEEILELLVEGGQQIGLGDFRPEKGGPFGTFQVVNWKEWRAQDAEEDKPPATPARNGRPIAAKSTEARPG